MTEQEELVAHMSEIEKPILPSTIPEIRCSMCQSSTKILSTATARMGFEHWTLRCTSCGHIDQVQVNVGAAETVGRLAKRDGGMVAGEGSPAPVGPN
jgi:RNase P subunit RPR2